MSVMPLSSLVFVTEGAAFVVLFATGLAAIHALFAPLYNETRRSIGGPPLWAVMLGVFIGIVLMALAFAAFGH